MRYSYIFKYESDWMIVLYENNRRVKYFNSAEHYWDDAIDYEKLFNPNKRYYYKLPSYDYVKDIDIFDLNENGIEDLKMYIV